MAVLTPLSNLDVRAIVQHHGLGELEHHWPATEGVENTNYFLRVGEASRSAGDNAGPGGSRNGQRPAREYVLTVLESGASPDAVLLPVLAAAAAAGLPVAAPLADRNGRFVTTVAGKPALLAPRLPGAHPDTPNERQCAAVGRFLARFHRATAPLAANVPQHPRDANWMATTRERTQALLPWAERQRLADAIAAASQLLARTDVRRLPHAVVHGDLFRDNALFAGSSLTGVLDFHHAARAALVFDLAVTINDWCVSDTRLDQARAWALLRAYDAIRPLAAAELWFLPAFMLLAATAFWLSRLQARASARGDAPIRSPAHMAALLDTLQRHPPVFDPRLLLRAA